MFKRILKWTGIIVSSIILLLVVVIALRQDLRYDAPFPEVAVTADSAFIAKGRQLVYGAAHCVDCHGDVAKRALADKGEEIPLSGGNVFKLPLGEIYAKNITPDKETGIGNWTDAEIARALRYGVKRDGKVVFDFMPFHNTSDEDLSAIISYLRSTVAVKNVVPEHDLNAAGLAVKALLIKPVGPSGPVPTSVRVDSTAEYGRYVVNNVANCKGCHTPRDMMTGKYVGEDLSGGNIDGIDAPNLTPDSSGRLFKWTEDMFVNRFKQGRIIEKSPMPWSSFSRMTETELKAVYKYLQTVKPVRTEPKQVNLTASR